MKFPLVRFFVVCRLAIGLCAAALTQETQLTTNDTVLFTTKGRSIRYYLIRIFDAKSGTLSLRRMCW